MPAVYLEGGYEEVNISEYNDTMVVLSLSVFIINTYNFFLLDNWK